MPETKEQPAQIGNSIPDLTAITSNGERVIEEVKTSNDIDNDHTKGQLTDYIRSGAEVMLLVPEISKPIADQALQNWGLLNRVQVWSWG